MTALRNRYPMVFVPGTRDPDTPADSEAVGMYIAASERHFGIFLLLPSFEQMNATPKEEFEADVVQPISDQYGHAAAVYIKRMMRMGIGLPLPAVPEGDMDLDYEVVRLEGLNAGQSGNTAGPTGVDADRFCKWFLFIAPAGVPMEEFLSDAHTSRLN